MVAQNMYSEFLKTCFLSNSWKIETERSETGTSEENFTKNKTAQSFLLLFAAIFCDFSFTLMQICNYYLLRLVTQTLTYTHCLISPKELPL